MFGLDAAARAQSISVTATVEGVAQVHIVRLVKDDEAEELKRVLESYALVDRKYA